MEPRNPKPARHASGRRSSVFVEVGLVDEDRIRQERSPAPTLLSDPTPRRLRPSRVVRFRSQDNIFEDREAEEREESDASEWDDASSSESDDGELATGQSGANSRMNANSGLYRFSWFTLVLALLLPILGNPLTGVGVRGGAIPRQPMGHVDGLEKRDDTNTNICKRWSHQSAVVNGTLYVYGGRSSTDAQQKSNTWNNDFLTLDLTKSWQISNPSLTGLPKPSGPPKVANAYLWNSHQSLFLYGGEFSDTPLDSPTAFSLWEYNIGSKQWVEHQNPKTSAGDNSEGDGQPVQRAAEGAGFGVSILGRGWYFGGHLDDHTTQNWSNQIGRVYMKGLLEFTFPSFGNNAVQSLKSDKKAGSDGVWRNITQGGLQDTAGFTERADGLLIYVPGFGDEGLLLGLAGGDNNTFTQMNVIDVYDIAKSTWYKQSTSGSTPKFRVNPCAVVAAAADGSSYNMYMFGGQNLQPAGDQTQYDDMWILSIPSFTWIQVDTSKQSVPPGRAGHTCNVWDGQMIVVGGYVGQQLSCDSPGIYVFNMSSLQWANQFTALTGQSVSDKNADSANPLGQQANQRGFDAKSGLEGSYGYAVPAAVQSVIGGKETGGATLTAPVQTPTAGPLASGKPITYTVTGPGGAIITTTALPNASNSGGGNGARIGAIVAGTVAGVFAVIAAYFAFCAWVYRKQVKLYKNHAAMAQRSANAEKAGRDLLGVTAASSGKNSSDRGPAQFTSTTGSSTADEIRRSNERDNAVETDGLNRRASTGSLDDLLQDQEPTFWGTRGVLLNPRRSLRVINRD